MAFCFYPKHEHGCPHVSHCPHLGGAALGTLVQMANENDESRDYLYLTLDAERERSARLFEENQRLKKELERVKLELKLERQNKFATPQQKRGKTDESASQKRLTGLGKKRGAPVGHPGWFRPRPVEYDWAIDVPAPKQCPHCRRQVTVRNAAHLNEHWQEDVIDGQYRVVLYRHPVARCNDCQKCLQQPGKDEILGSRVGPYLRSLAIYLRNVIGISYRKIPQIVQEFFGITFTAAALIGFEKRLAERSEPIVDDIAKKLGSHDGAVHADETYSTLDGERAYYWVHADEKRVHFRFDTTRSGEVSRDVLGNDFSGTLVTDCYSGYEAHSAGAKQKCLAHLARTASDWQKLTEEGSVDFIFFDCVRQFVKRGCLFHRQRNQLTQQERAKEKRWLHKELLRLEAAAVNHDKALTLQARLVKHHDEWLVFVEDSRVPPTNNLAERALRPLVILRKITFGHRSLGGGQRMAQLMTVAETARRHFHRASEIFFDLFLHPPHRVLRRLYAPT